MAEVYLMAKLTREEVVQRAYYAYPLCCYVYDTAGMFTGYQIDTKYGKKYPMDCSAFVAWCWGWSKRTTTADLWASSMCVRGVQAGATIEEAFPGITPGDALIKRKTTTGHTGIYVGNNTFIHASTSDWASLPPCGVGLGYGVRTWMGYVKYDNDNSFDYDPDTEDPVTKPNPEWEHVPEEYPTWANGDLDRNANLKAMNKRYIRNYKLCKYMRKGGL